MMMTKHNYMSELERLLAKVPDKQRREWLFDYYSHFQQAEENGQSEHEAALELGDPRQIASELLLGYKVQRAEAKKSFGNTSKAVLATVSLGFFNIVFVLGPYAAAVGVLIALWATTLALGLAGVTTVLESTWSGMFTLTQAASIGLVCIGLSILLGIGVNALTKGFFAATIKYLKFNTKIIRGKKQ
ncbi:HAAS signaling domain-containing protein [Paenibacillus sp. Leaf72]|uniref:HAAS signaling domain-containing protein n=1 Tax=Paenibacillus sp. Leaf72 TaxID=1736234 RepID=UPI0006F5E1FE|nr:DUF1700 domain-containing protein [Paenibacillus sp. Leaf72]KQO01041.1 hypothetical protein ASF12_14375 [Paenibacillus sp. Leaf72]